MDCEVVSGIIGSGPSGCLFFNNFQVSSLFGARPEDAKILQALANISQRDCKINMSRNCGHRCITRRTIVIEKI